MQNISVEYLLARTIAQELLLRGLYAKWAVESPHPRESNRKMLDGMVATMWAVEPPKDDDERRLYQSIEACLQEFRDQVDTRLKGEGFPE
ncbi:MAG: hypothetical protein ABSC25_24365 [Roseiarcus sp.]|jgi:hypothetical protein